MHLSGIFHFFVINDYDLRTKKIKRFLPEDESDYYAKDRPYSVKEIEQILSKCDVRARACVLIMTSTGMRIGGLKDLQIGDLKKIDEFGLYMIWVYNRSRKDCYYTFTTPECAKAIDEYLEYRKRTGGEDISKDKFPLIRDKFRMEDYFKAPKFISIRTLSHVFEDALRRAGVNQPTAAALATKSRWQKKRDVMFSHGFRKFFITQCDKAHISFTVREYPIRSSAPLCGCKLHKNNRRRTVTGIRQSYSFANYRPNSKTAEEGKRARGTTGSRDCQPKSTTSDV